MILFINTSLTDLIQVKLIKDDKVIGRRESHEEFKQAELLLSMIDKLIKNLRIKIKNLKLIVVVSGPGAFSALRLGITTANTLAWAFQAPIVELSSDEVQDDKSLIFQLKEKVKRLENCKIGSFQLILPKYGKEPNITKSNINF